MELNVEIKTLTEGDEIPYPLLLLADPSLEKIKDYLSGASIFIAKENNFIVGCLVLSEVDKISVEIKNISVQMEYQRKGLGKLLIADAINRSRKLGYRKVIIGTGNSSIWQLYLYQKLGFRISSIKKDYFVNHYKEPIIENGIPCRDLIELSLELVD